MEIELWELSLLGIIKAVGVDKVIENSISQPSLQRSYCFGKHTPPRKNLEKQTGRILWVMGAAENHCIILVPSQQMRFC